MNALSSPAITVNGLQTYSLAYLELVATTVDCGWPSCNRHSKILMTDYSSSHGDRMLHAKIIDIPERARSEQPRDLTTLLTSSNFRLTLTLHEGSLLTNTSAAHRIGPSLGRITFWRLTLVSQS